MLLAIDTWALDRTPRSSSAARDPAVTATAHRKPAPSPSCEADAALATAARLVYCSTPAQSTGDCARDAMRDFAAARLTCTAVALSTEVSLVDPKVLDQIEPEPLIELLDPVDQQQFEKALQEAVEEKFREEQAKRAAKPAATQVVEVTPPEVEKAPEQSRFISEYNSQVEKQTVARGSVQEEMVARPKPAELQAKERPRDDPAIQKPPDELPRGPVSNPANPVGPGALSMRKGQAATAQEEQLERIQGGTWNGSEAPRSDNGIAPRRGDGPGTDNREAREAGGDVGGGGRPLVPNLRPSEDILERAAGGGSVDWLKDVEQGDATALNTVAWKHASFFNRLKRRVGQEWRARELHWRRDPHGNVYGTKDRVTILQVALDRSGKLAKIYVMKGCGVEYLDDEAVRAFRVAQPFPNPPVALADPRTGLITFTFGFILEIGEPRLLKIFQQ